MLSTAVDLAFIVDGLSLMRLGAFGSLNRPRKLMEAAYTGDPSRPNSDGPHIYMGEGEDGSGAHIRAALRPQRRRFGGG